MLVSVKPVADFSEGCANRTSGYLLFVVHPRRSAIRELSHPNLSISAWHFSGRSYLSSLIGSAADHPSKERGGREESPLFGVVCLQFASALAQKELRGEYLVVWVPTHDRLDVCPCCSHSLGDVICEFCDRRTGKLLSRRYERRDTALSLLGIEDLVVVRRRILGGRITVLGDHSLVLLDV
jgi:hypothetical protein